MSTIAPSVRHPTLVIRGVEARNPFVLAPLDGYTDLPFRMLCRRAGVGIAFTEMISSIPLTMGGRDSRRRLKAIADDHPLGVQIVGHDPAVMARAARVAQDSGAELVDVNAGCPSRKVTNGGSGAALLSDLPLLQRILEAIRKAVTIPLTLKVRSGPTAGQIVVDDVARIVRETGVDAVTLHPRTRAQAFSGRSDWRLIARLKAQCTVPVIGNGDVASGADGIRMLDETGCDGVMVGRAAIGDPWIFAELDAAWRGLPAPARPQGPELLRWIVEHFDMLSMDVGDETRAASVFRKHLHRYVRGFPGAARVRRSLCSLDSRAALLRTLSTVMEPGDDS